MADAGDKPLAAVEGIKARSDYLRGTIAEGLADPVTGALAEDDTQLSKFHGIYQQDDRDSRAERLRAKLEPAHSFMIRVRVPGGIATPAQWLAMDDIARTHANYTLRLTTRQAFQFHGVVKTRLRETIRAINGSLLDTIAACGDVNRNVMCTPLPEKSAVHEQAYATSVAISRHLTPRTRAYHEIWLDGRKHTDSRDNEPLYGPTYLPRKFKIGVVVPPANDVDVLSQDLGYIAVEREGSVAGYNVAVGGGMGMSHGDAATYPRVADVIGFCTPAQAVAVAEAVVTIQRDFGDRGNRKHARLKYTIDDRGLDWFVDELRKRSGFELRPPEPWRFICRGDEFGWQQGTDGGWHLGLFVPEGRVRNTPDHRFLDALRGLAASHQGTFRLTPNQNLIVSGIADSQRADVERLLHHHGIDALQAVTPLRAQALACVALPSCGLAMAEAERYLPTLVSRVDRLLSQRGLSQESVSLRVTGCPNGCARPYLAEIALVGKAPGRYALFLGGSRDGTRLNRLVLENADESQILGLLDDWFERFARQRDGRETFGDFVHRAGQIAPAGER